MAPPTTPSRPPRGLTARLALACLLVLPLAGCERRGGCTGDYCGTLVFAATAEPDILLLPVTQQAAARDVSEQLFLKLADLGLSGNTFGDEDFQPLLAQRWEWDDPSTLVFHLDPRARWHDGRPVTAADVEFTFAVYTDSLVNSPSRSSLRAISAVKARDSLTAVFRFRQRYPEMFYDAVYHMAILPAHLLRNVPRERWRSAEFGRAPVGSGPYRFVRWKAGESIELAADSTFFLGRPHIRRLIWRFTPDLQVAVTQVIAGDADAIEVLGPPDNVKRVRATPQLVAYPYRGAVYGFLGFNLAASGDTTRPHSLFGDRELRRALAMAVDRQGLLKNVWGDLAQVPPGPLARIWSIWDPQIRELPYDTAQARRRLTRLGWVDSNGDGIRDRNGEPLAFRILVPTTSGLRRQYARLLQQQYRAAGADVQLDEVEFSVFDERTRMGRFDAALVTRNTDPTPSSSLAQLWTRAGFGGSNYGRWANPVFDGLVDQARAATRPAEAKRLWRRAIEVLNDDAPAVFLFAPDNVAAIHRRVADVVIRPDSYWALVRLWRIPADQLTERDRLEP